ncbi:putative DNA ligase-like protein Rv0938/MT0965 [Rhizobium favelukesii]|uniref:DNA ligase (ATP) n=1 Tax=Rhizobium favelukesii TaxID=348824 RepID=W6R7H2_9HYPH|nr:putative DNA ligase-like protein Rv0938/MT0965 [Rhizobium favelukesii]
MVSLWRPAEPTPDPKGWTKSLEGLAALDPPVEYGGRRKNLVWVQPTRIAEIEYRAWTHEGKLRHASYKGLREVQDNAAVFEILPEA